MLWHFHEEGLLGGRSQEGTSVKGQCLQAAPREALGLNSGGQGVRQWGEKGEGSTERAGRAGEEAGWRSHLGSRKAQVDIMPTQWLRSLDNHVFVPGSPFERGQRELVPWRPQRAEGLASQRESSAWL